MACSLLALAGGCLAPPKPHAWEVSHKESQLLQEADQWPQLSTNRYVRVTDQLQDEAVGLLQDSPFVQLDEGQFRRFAPALHPPSRSEFQPFLVRGASYASRPVYTLLRFDATGGRLLIKQATYNGEMLMPFRWVAEPNALVVLLPEAPSQVYPYALLAGDGIFRGSRMDTVDTR